MINTASPKLQALILSPTGELAIEVKKAVLDIGYFAKVQACVCNGGIDILKDRKPSKKIHVVSGTPGRVHNMIERKILSTNAIKLLVLHEFEETLSDRLKNEIHEVYNCLPSELQVVMISTTLPSKILEINFLKKKPVRILVKRDELTLEGIKQFFVRFTNEEERFTKLHALFNGIATARVVVFCNTKRKVEWLEGKMFNNGIQVSSIHDDMPLEDRHKAMSAFRSGIVDALVTTDAWTMSLDIHQVFLVINYELPNNREFYIRRIGRSLHFGCKVLAINFVHINEEKILREMKEYYDTQIEEMPDEKVKNLI